MRQDLVEGATTLTGEVVRDVILDQRRRLELAVDGLDRQTLETVPICGTWSARDLVGHLKDWQDVLLASARYAIGGPRPLDMPVTDGDAFNARNAAARMNDRWVETRADYDASLNEILAWIESLTPEQLATAADYPWGASGGTVASLMGAVAGHLDEHCGQIEEWRQAVA